MDHSTRKSEKRRTKDREDDASSGASDEWICVKEAARYLSVSPSTVRRYIKRGYLRSSRLPSGRRLRLLRSDVEKLLQAESPQTGSLSHEPVDGDEPGAQAPGSGT
jgi:excisionase family DNA binding protein